jgi:hypothetical protein
LAHTFGVELTNWCAPLVGVALPKKWWVYDPTIN